MRGYSPCFAGILTTHRMLVAVGIKKRLGKPKQCAVTGHAEDEIGIGVINCQLHQFGVGEMAITTQYDLGVWPGSPQALEYAFDDHGIFHPFGALAGPQHGADELAGNPFKHEQWQVAIATVVVVIEAQFLLTMGSILRMIHIEHNQLGWFGVAGDELIDEGPGQAMDVFSGCGILQAGERGGTG